MRKALIAMGVIFLLSCGKKGQEEKKPPTESQAKVLAKVGDIEITEDDMSSQVPGVGQFTLNESDKKMLLEGLEKLTVFYLAAKDEGLPQDPQVARRAEWAKRAVLADEFLKRQLENVQVTDADIAEYVKQHEKEFGKEVNLVEVGFSEAGMADTVRKLLKDGSYAASKMLEYFMNQGAIVVNPIGYVNVAALRFNMPQDAAEAVAKAKRGDVLGPFDVQNMHVLVMVADMRKANPDMKKIEPVLKQALLAEKNQAIVDSLYQDLKAKYTTQKEEKKQ